MKQNEAKLLEFKYSPRIISYIDILGFSALVTDHIHANRCDYINLIGYLLSFVKIVGSDKSHYPPEDINFTQFSDTIILTAPVSDVAFSNILSRTSDLIQALLSTNNICRGAIVIGDLCEKNDIIFGPGLIEAHALESKTAKYPRVIVANDLFKKLGHKDSLDFFNCNRMIRDPNISKDSTDNFDYIDYFSNGFYTDVHHFNICSHLRRIYSIIESGLKIKDEKINDKYIWMKTKYNQYATKIKTTCKDESIWRTEDFTKIQLFK